MQITRRRLLQTGGAGLALAGTGAGRLWAATELSFGGVTVQTLSDGHLVLPADFIFGPMPEAELAPLLSDFGLSADAPLNAPCNVTLLRDGDRVVLFDAGAGNAFQPSAGELLGALDAAGLAPEDITHVVFTHGHPDHLWGVLDDFDDPLFANATHLMGRAEWAYWYDPATVDSIGSARTSFAVGARRRLEVLEDAITFFDDGAEILPGVAARASFGHTPGHMSFEIRRGTEAVMVVGDAIGNGHLAFARPGWPSGSDQDQTLAAATRLALLDQLAYEQMRLIGFHLPAGGLGRAEKTSDGYRFVPEAG
ncbi:MBL fold metallo-hydrolase [Pseudodonghicola flavimaris]|uniref:MBL fold metallo-hydrolase n=1 Tax=Pseudodonghicola flavimaris TaxID=3050036 RepID=A0ABT7EXZ4_9RHOB|nr:MBL fold metallo-hydrolase [Pseudodonghicola flavimaris]MDK3017220.1 MBL fold metallo-hydrolase [Pseudodonghicola flavimaris]